MPQRKHMQDLIWINDIPFTRQSLSLMVAHTPPQSHYIILAGSKIVDVDAHGQLHTDTGNKTFAPKVDSDVRAAALQAAMVPPTGDNVYPKIKNGWLEISEGGTKFNLPSYEAWDRFEADLASSRGDHNRILSALQDPKTGKFAKTLTAFSEAVVTTGWVDEGTRFLASCMSQDGTPFGDAFTPEMIFASLSGDGSTDIRAAMLRVGIAPSGVAHFSVISKLLWRHSAFSLLMTDQENRLRAALSQDLEKIAVKMSTANMVRFGVMLDDKANGDFIAAHALVTGVFAKAGFESSGVFLSESLRAGSLGWPYVTSWFKGEPSNLGQWLKGRVITATVDAVELSAKLSAARKASKT